MISARMTRQIDRGVLSGLILGLGFTFFVIFLFERGIPQRLLQRPLPPASKRFPKAARTRGDSGAPGLAAAAKTGHEGRRGSAGCKAALNFRPSMAAPLGRTKARSDKLKRLLK